MANMQNNQMNNVSVNLGIKGQVSFSSLVKPEANQWGQEQYSITLENPEFENPTNDPTTANVINFIQTQSGLVRQGNEQYPNPSIALYLRATRQDGTPQKPRYFDRSKGQHGAEIPVENNIARGVTVTAAVGARMTNSSSHGVSLYLNGIIFDDTSKPGVWYAQNPLIAGFASLPNSNNTVANAPANQPAANAGAGQPSFNRNTNPSNPWTGSNTQNNAASAGQATPAANNGANSWGNGATAPQSQVAPQGQTAPQGQQPAQPQSNGQNLTNPWTGTAAQSQVAPQGQTAPQGQQPVQPQANGQTMGNSWANGAQQNNNQQPQAPQGQQQGNGQGLKNPWA